MTLGIGNQSLARIEVPEPPRCDHLNSGPQCIVSEFEAYLVIPFPGRSVGHGIGLLSYGNVDLSLGDERPCDRCPQEIRTLVNRIGPQHGKDIMLDKFFPEVIYINLAGPRF